MSYKGIILALVARRWWHRLMAKTVCLQPAKPSGFHSNSTNWRYNTSITHLRPPEAMYRCMRQVRKRDVLTSDRNALVRSAQQNNAKMSCSEEVGGLDCEGRRRRLCSRDHCTTLDWGALAFGLTSAGALGERPKPNKCGGLSYPIPES